MEWQIGKANITAIVEQPLDEIEELIPAAKHEETSKISWLKPHFADEDGVLLGIIQMFVVDINGKTLVIDTCIGDNKDIPLKEAWHKKQFGLLEKFTKAGFNPNQVDFVLCTHMHLDHVGLNTMKVIGQWMPTFPNARYLFAKNELEFWQDSAKGSFQDPDTEHHPGKKKGILFQLSQRSVHKESVQPVIDAGLADMVDTPYEPIHGVKLIPTPGHTPGHVSIEINSEGHKVFISGDSFHHPCQIARPDWWTVADIDRDASSETRHKILKELVGTQTFLLGTHFAEPSGGYIVEDGDSYKLKCD